MSKRTITILGLLFSILIVEVVILLPGETGPGSSGDKALATPAPLPANAPGQVMQDVHIVEAREAGKEWELNAKKGTRPKDGSNWKIEQVDVKFFAKNGVTYDVTGDSGTVMTSATNDVRDVTITGNVVTHSSNGYIFKTDMAHYDTTEHMLHTPGDVKMTGPKEKDGTSLVLTGTDMLANLLTNDILIQQNVHGRKNIRENKTAVISSHSAQFSGVSKETKFLDDVVIDVETLRITGHEASFIYKDGSADSALVKGGVRVTDSEKYATADRVSVYFKEDKYVFNGSPRVVQSGDELVGEEITFLNDGKKVQVSNARVKLDRKDLDAQRDQQKKGQH